MTNELHTKDFLALELLKADLPHLALNAVNGYYHDFLSPLAFPDIQLARDLEDAGTYAAMAIYKRHLRGEFDATKKESDDWAASPEGRAAMAALRGEKA